MQDNTSEKQKGMGQDGDSKEQLRDKLPELELKKIKKSSKEIFDYPRNSNLQAWNSYTIAISRGSDDLQVFDENCLGVGIEFGSDIIVDWRKAVTNKKIKDQPITDDKGNSNYTMVDELPFELRAVARQRLKYPSNIVSFNPKHEHFHTTHLKATEFMFLLDKYLVFYSPRGAFFVCETKDERGVELKPRDWKVLLSTDLLPKELSEEIEKKMENMMGVDGTYKDINETYFADINDVGINFLKKGSDSIHSSLLFSEKISSVGSNLVVDPTNSMIVYYCQSNNPQSLNKLDLSGDPKSWKPIKVGFIGEYEEVRNLQLDPSGHFLFFNCGKELIILASNTLDEVKRIPDLTNVHFDSTNKIRAVDQNTCLVVYESNLAELAEELEKKKLKNLAEGLQLDNIFDLEASKPTQELKNAELLKETKENVEKEFSNRLSETAELEEVLKIRQSLDKLRAMLKKQGFKSNEIIFVTEGLEEMINLREKDFANEDAQTALDLVRSKLAGGLSITSVSEARAEMKKIKAMQPLLKEDLRKEVQTVALELEERSMELFKQRGDKTIEDVQGIINRTKTNLEAFTSKSQMDEWLEFDYPQLRSSLASLANDVPLEANQAFEAISKARTQLQEIASTFEDKFKREYARVREKASERISATADILEQDIDGLIERLRSKGFASRSVAEQYLSSSEALKALEAEIAGLSIDYPDIAKELEKNLKVSLSNTLMEIDRGALTQVAETGQQMVAFGDTLFPKWEAKVKEKVERKVEVIFEEDPKTHGPGVKAADILGDIALSIQTTTGKIDKVRLYEGWQDESEWRLGLFSFAGEAIPPSYLSAAEFRHFKKDYMDWTKGENSELRRKLEEKRNVLKDHYAKRQKIGERTSELDEAWQEEFREKLRDYGAFANEHHIPLLRRIDEIKKQPEIEYTNGKGFVPEWQNHWVMDYQTEDDLSEMAQALKMQLDLKEGLVVLKGHAGTGKDVRIKMFAALTNRPYFGIDGTKWTTEFELSEDVMLESKDGASQTVKVPSAVLNGITTPGAIVYFNEFNAMPEQAQIFLHALMDEKRSLTLKTSSGKTVRALPSVLLVGSMNPNYDGTFKPQYATRSRMVSLEVTYPPLMRKLEAEDGSSELLYDSSEALRVARGVDSLADLTYEANLEHNEFVKIWDNYVNGIDNNAPELTQVQQFDIDTILALIQFTNKLRVNFIKTYEKSREKGVLKVDQPISGRELRRAAHALSKMSNEEKLRANPENVARDLLDKYFLTHIDIEEDRDKIRSTMNIWTSEKRAVITAVYNN